MNRPLLLLLLVVLFACTKRSPKLEYALQNAGENRAELLKVIDHYSVNQEDSLRLKAALFLIENMPFHYSYYGSKVDSGTSIFEEIKVLQQQQSKVDDADKIALADSINKRQRSAQLSDSLLSDNKTISASYLINTVDIAFTTWQNSPWNNQVSFNQFCNYILPYRIRKEQPEYWRNYLSHAFKSHKNGIKGSHNLDSLFDYYNATYYKIEGSEFLRYYQYDMNFTQLNLVRAGECLDRCAYQLYHARAAGIPATFDYIPNWGNRPFSRHAMVGNASKRQQVDTLISNNNSGVGLSNSISSATPKPAAHYFTEEELPHGVSVQYLKTVPKVYRTTWLAQPDILDIYTSVPHDQIVQSLLKMTMLDVTSQYLETADIKLQLTSNFLTYKIAYLAVFDPKGWSPVAYTLPDDDGNLVFNDMGKNILYMPMVYKSKVLTPIGDPIILKNDGTINTITCNKSHPIEMTLVRKFPLFSYTSNHNYWIKGIYFEGTNNPDFKNAQRLHVVDYYPFGMQKAIVTNKNKYRYIRCCPIENGRLQVAEIAIYGKQDNKERLLAGRPFASSSNETMIAKAFDGNMLSFYQSFQNDEALCIDLGEGNSAQITQISFAPRNDDNYIVPGYNYELYMWDGKWKFISKQIASDYKLVLKEIPSDGLYWLKCKEGGKEERIFTYKKEGQIWW